MGLAPPTLTTQLVEIEKIVAGGLGLARRPDAPVVLVPRTAAGERVEVEIQDVHVGWTRGRAVRVVEASSARRDPPCPHYGVCGGCQLQHLRYAAQLEAKSGIVAESLARLGGLAVAPPEVVGSPREFEYRNRVTLILRRQPDGGLRAGYHADERSSEIIDVETCPLAEPALNRVWAALRAAWGPGAERLPRGPELRLTLRATLEGAVGLLIEGGEGRGRPDELLSGVEGLRAIWSLDRNGRIKWQEGSPTLVERWGDVTLEVAGQPFLQVNRDVAAALETYVLAECGAVDRHRVVDAYCGYGLRAIELARRGARAVGIDTDGDALGGARSRAAELGLRVRFARDRVERRLARELPAYLVVLNPPRFGLARPVVDALLRQAPARVVYVSCDPATLARDLKRLGPSFELSACRAFDMFPQTAHVESVVTLVRRPQVG